MLQHEQQQSLIDAIINRFDADMTKTILDIERLINQILLKEGFTEATALNFEVLFIDALEQSGYYQKVNDLVDNQFDELYASIRKGLNDGGFAVRYDPDDLTKITGLKNLQLDQFNNLASDAAKSVQQNLYKYVLGNFTLDSVQRQILQDFKGTNLARHSTTLARTAIGEFQQSVIDIKAEGLDGVWIYTGVNDGATRDYCKSVLKDNHYYTTAQKNDVMADKRREFNCRHRARLVSKEFAIQQGYTSA